MATIKFDDIVAGDSRAAREETKGGALVFDDITKTDEKPTNAQLDLRGAGPVAQVANYGAAILEAPGKILYTGVGGVVNALRAMGAAAVSRVPGVPESATNPETRERQERYSRMSFGDAFVAAFNDRQENLHHSWRPLTSGSEAVSNKLAEWSSAALQYIGDDVFDKGFSLNPLTALVPTFMVPKEMRTPGTAGSPLAAAAQQTAGAAAAMVLPVPLGRGKKAPEAKPVASPAEAWKAFSDKYPETAKTFEGRDIGTVRMNDFIPEDKTIFDQMHRKLNKDLSLPDDDRSPINTKIAAALQRTDPTLPASEALKGADSVAAMWAEADRLREVRALDRGLPSPDKVQKPVEPGTRFYATPGGRVLSEAELHGLTQIWRTLSPNDRAKALGYPGNAVPEAQKGGMPSGRSAAESTVDLTGDAPPPLQLAAPGVYQASQLPPGLPRPGAISDKPVIVTKDGIAITPDQAVKADEAFLGMTPEMRANALGLSATGRLRLRLEEAQALEAQGKVREARAARNALSREWAQTFPYRDAAKRNAALEAFENFGGRMTWEEASAKMGDPTPTGVKKGITKAGPGAHQLGMIDIEGLAYSLQSFKDLPDKPVLKRATILGALQQAKVPETERQVVLKALGDRDSISQAELKGEIAAQALPLRARDTLNYATQGIENVGFKARVDDNGNFPARTTVWQMPDATTSSNHFNDPNYFAHSRSFDRAGVRHIVEVQSDLMQQAHQSTKPYAVLSKSWVERVIAEENRRASADGVPIMRVADANTMVKVQGWPSDVLTIHEGSTYKHYPNGYWDPMVSDFPTNKPAWVRLGERDRQWTGRVNNNEVITDVKLTEILDKNLRSGDVQVQVDDAFMPIYRRHQKEIPSFLQKNFGAKRVVDENGNGWWEWNVKAAAADEKIPAFGGRLNVGPGGKQKGALKIEGFTDEDFVKAKDTFDKAAGRTWAVPDADQEKVAASKVQAAFNKSFAIEEESAKVTLGSRMARLRRGVIGHDYDVKAALEGAGPYGEQAKARMVLQRGATDAAKVELDRINEKIFNRLMPEEKKNLDEIMRARRIIEIDSYKGVGKVRHEGGVTGPEAEAFVRNLRRNIGEEQFAKVWQASDQVMAEYKTLLASRLEKGLISSEDFNKLIHFDYSPTQYLDLIDPVLTFNIHGRKITVRGSGIQDLGRGRAGSVMMNSQELLAEAIARTRNLEMKNNTLNSLWDLAVSKPDNGIVQIVNKGRPNSTAPQGWSRLGVRRDGRQLEILMRDEYAEQFVSNPQPMLPWVANALRVLSGGATLRATAVGLNPIFPVAGLPMDILHTWMATSRAYSTNPVVYMAQIGKDMLEVLPSLRNKDGAYQQAMKEGMGAHYMTAYGQHVFTRDRTVSERLMPHYEKVTRALAGFNQEADLLVRLAHRNRLIKNGMPSEMATAAARDRLDYAQGGELIKGIDNIIPWTNVGVQALTKVLQAAKRDPADFAMKLTWVGGAIAANTVAQMMTSPEAWKSIPTADKIRGLPITFGDQAFIIDQDGNKRYLYTVIRLDQTTAPLTAAIIGGLEQAEYGRMPDKLITETAGQWVNLFGGPDLVPMISAVAAQTANIDLHTGRPIYTGPNVKPEDETRKNTSPIAKAIAPAMGMSPARSEVAFGKLFSTSNLWLNIAGGGLKALLDDSDPREKAKLTEQVFLEHMRPVVKMTNPLTQFLQGTEEVLEAEGSARKKQTDALDQLVFKMSRGEGTGSDITAYINTQPPEDRERLARHAKIGYQVERVMLRGEAGSAPGVPPKDWWKITGNAPARARAQEFHSKWLSASPEARKKMEAIASQLERSGTGYMSDDFRRELAKERQQLGTDHR